MKIHDEQGNLLEESIIPGDKNSIYNKINKLRKIDILPTVCINMLPIFIESAEADFKYIYLN